MCHTLEDLCVWYENFGRTKPALTGKWEERWWDVYCRCYAKGFPNAPDPEAAAQAADQAVDIARKHLEGE